MVSKILDFFKDDQDTDPAFIRLTRNILVFVLFVNIALLPLVTGLAGETSRNPRALITLSITLVLEAISFYYVLNGKIRMAKAVVPLALIAAVVVISFTSNGLKNASITGLPIILVISAILLGKRSIAFVVPLTVGATLLIAYYDLKKQIPYVPVGLDDAIILPILLIGCAGIIPVVCDSFNSYFIIL